MYIFTIYADIKIVLAILLIVSIFALFSFPMKINLKFIFSKELRKIFYTIKLYNFIKINSGYLELKDFKLFIHISNKKALFIKLNPWGNKSIKIIKDYHVKDLKSYLEIGGNALEVSTIAFLINYIDLIIKWFLLNSKPYVLYKNTITVFNNKKFNYFIKVGVYVNLLMIIISIIKILMGKIKNAVR